MDDNPTYKPGYYARRKQKIHNSMNTNSHPTRN